MMASDEPGEAYAGEKFRLRRGATLIARTLPQIDAQAGRLATAVAWFWSLYVVVVATWSLFGDRLTVASAIPVVALMISYLLALYAHLPVAARFDPRAPELVRIAHERIIRVKMRRLIIALSALLFSAVSIAVALLTALG